MIVKLLIEHHLEFINLKRRLQRLVRVYTCQKATLLEITCHGSCISLQAPESFYRCLEKLYDTNLRIISQLVRALEEAGK